MSHSKVLLGSASQEIKPREIAPRSGNVAWEILALIGAVLAIVGAVDLAVAWVPSQFGNPEWEFGTVSATLDGFPILGLGIALVMAGSLALGRARSARAAAAVAAALAILVPLIAAIYALTLPVALGAVTEPASRIMLLKAIAKTAVQVLLYPPVLLWIAIRGWRGARLASHD